MWRFFFLLAVFSAIAQVHQLSNAQTQPTHTCRVILRGTPGSAGDPISLDEFSLNCWTGDQAGPNTTQHTPHSSTDTPVRVQLGKELLEFLGQKTSDLLGVSSDWSARPLTPVSRDGSPADDGYELSRSEDWGLDIINVPHLKLVDSVISGVPLSDVAPLLQCLNCSRLTAQNVTIKALQRPSNKAPFGAVRITGLQDAILEGIECSNIRDAMGWACILIQAQAKSSIIVRDSSFLSNSVKRYYLHDFLRSSDSGLPPFPELQYSSPPTAGANLSSTSMSAVPVLRHALICKTDGGYALHDDDDPQIDGYGSVLIVYDRDDNLCGTQHPLDDAMNATVLVERTTISHNMGACGAGIAVQSPSFPQMVGCLSNRHVQLTFVSSIIMYNEADQLDGGGGGGLYFRDSWGGTVHLTIRNESILSSNRACCGVGGAAALQSDSIGDVMFVNTQVSNNTGDRGGGLYLGEFVNLSGLLVYNSTFSNNHALYLGGAIYVEPKEASNGVIKDIRFDGGSILHGNSAYEQGGAIYVRFRGNTATPELTRLVVDGASQMSENQAKNGGAICIQGYNAAVTVNEVLVTGGSELAGNLANNGDGGAIYLSFQGELSNFTIMGASRFSRNTANCTKTDCTSSRGGAIYLSAGKVKHPVLITGGASILSNSAKDAGGAIYMDNGDHSTGLVVSGGSNISCNMAGPTGGAIHIYTASSWAGASYLLQFDAGAVASYNTAQTSGGFLYMFGHAAMEVNLIVNSCNFIQNTAVQGSGGAVYMLQMQFLNVAIDGGSTIALNTAKRQGGAFSLDASRIDLDITGASSISDNLAVGDGGGIYLTAESTDIHVHGSMLSNNKATSGNGGAMSAEGLNSMTVTGRGRLENNTAGGSGGAVMLKSSIDGLTHTVKWDNCSTLINNSASMKGGGLFAEVTTVKVYVVGESQWIGNTALDNGGALYIEANNSLVDVNEVSSLRVDERSQLSRNGAKSGGAIYVNGFADVQVGEGSDISLNTAKYDGGAVFLAQLPSKILVQSSSVSNNTAHRGSGGAFYVGTMEPVFQPHATEPSCVLPGAVMNASLNNATFVGNAAGVTDGGAFYLKPHETCVSSTFISLRINGSHFVENAALGAGGAVMLRDASNARFVIDIANSDFRDNTAGTVTGDFTSSANFGGALVVWREPSDAIGNFTESCQLTVNDTSFDGNSCDGGTGGAVMLISCASRFSRCNFTDNHATHSGGAMGALQMARSTATLGLVTTSTAASVAGLSQQEQSIPRDQRRLLVSDGSNMQHERISLGRVMRERDAIKDSKLWGRHRKLSAETGSCSVGSHSNAKWHTSLTACNFFNNTADREYGGAIYLYASIEDAQIFISGCAFEENKAVQQLAGAAFLAARGANTGVQVSDSSFNNNAAKLNSAGAVYALIGPGAYATLVNLSMTSNQAAVSAGAGVLDVRSNGSLCMQNAFFDQNRALSGDGGALLLKLQMESRASFNNCTFNDNKAAGNGGAMLMDGNCSSTLSVENSVMMRNQAGLSGGGIYILYSSKTGETVRGSAFGSSPIPTYAASASSCPDISDPARRASVQSVLLVGNTAGQHGGAIFLGSNSALTILNSTMLGNTACEGGGSMSAQNCSSLVLSHSTIQNSSTSGSGGGFWAYGCRRLLLEYVNITGNIARVSGGGLTFSGPTDDIAAEGLTGNTALGGETPQYTSMIVHRARVHDNAAALSSDTLEGCQGKDSFQPGEEGKGGGFFITGKVAGVLSLVNLEQSNNASLGSAIASTQRCKQANMSTASVKATIIDQDWINEWKQSWDLLDELAASRCWLLQLSDTLLPSLIPSKENSTSISSQQNRVLWVEDFLPSALHVSYTAKWNCTDKIYYVSEDEAVSLNEIRLSIKDRLSEAIRRRANLTDFTPGLVLNMGALNGTIPDAAAVAAGLSQRWYKWLLGRLCMCNLPQGEDPQAAMRQQSYLALPAAYMGLRLLDTDLVYSQRLQLQPGLDINLTAQLYDMSGQAVTWDLAPSTITLALRPRTSPDATYNATVADGSAPWLDNDVANLDAGLNRSLTVPVVNGSATWEGVKTFAWPGYYSLILQLTTNYSSFAMVAPLEMEVEVLPCGVGQTLDLSHSSLKTSYTGCRACPSDQYGLWQDDRPLLTDIQPRPGNATAADDSKRQSSYSESMNITLRAQNSACMLCPANALCLGGAVIVPAPGYWHSAANSTKIHTCPYPSACNVDGDKRTFPEWIYSMVGARDYRTGLLSWCQLAWYSSVVPGAAVLSAQMPGPPPEVTGDGLQPLEVLANNTAVLLTNIIALRRQNDTAPDISLPRCLVSGLPSGHLDSYMQQQCAEGYTGNLCAACIEGYYVDTDFNCKRCPSVARTVGLGLISFFGSVALILFTTITNFSDGFGEKTNGQQHANVLPGKGGDRVEIGDVVKVIVLHLQYLIIVTRLSVNYPSIILRCQAVFSAITGAENYLVYSPSCLLPDSDSAGQAFIQWLAGILTPCAVATVSMLLWALRYAYPLREALAKAFVKGARSAWATLAGIPKSLAVWKGRQLPSSRLGTDSVCGDEDMSVCSGQRADSIGPCPPPLAPLDTSLVTQDSHIGLRTVFRDVQIVALDAADPSAGVSTGVRVPSLAYSASGSTDALASGLPTAASAAPVVDLNGVELGPAAKVIESTSCGGNEKKSGLQPSPTCDVITNAEDQSDSTSDAPGILRADDAVSPSGPPLLRGGHSINILSGGTCIETAPTEVLSGINSGYGTSYYYRHPYEMWNRKPAKTLSSMGSAAISDAIRTLHKLRTLAVHTQQSSQATFLQVDKAMSLVEQLGVVLMAAVFILYPSWANAALSTFACYPIDDGEGSFPETQQATWRYGYWVRNMQAMCYSGDHLHVYVPIGVVAVVVFCVLPPLVSFIFVWRVRGRLEDAHVRKVYGFLYKRYKPRFIWWETVLELETLILVSVEVLGRGLIVSYQALLLLAAFTVIALINVSCAPLLSRLLVIMEFMSLGTLSLTITLSLYFTVDDELNPVAENALAILIIVLNTSLMLFFLYIASRHFWPSAVKKVAPRAQAVVRKLSSIGSNVSRQKDADMDGRGSEGDGQRVVRWPILCRLTAWWRGSPAAAPFGRRNPPNGDTLARTLDHSSDGCDDNGALVTSPGSGSRLASPHKNGVGLARVSVCLEEHLSNVSAVRVLKPSTSSHVCIQLDEAR